MLWGGWRRRDVALSRRFESPRDGLGATDGATLEYPCPTPKTFRPAARRRVRPMQRALNLLVRREHSRKELTRKLTSRGIEDEAAQAVAKLTEAGWRTTPVLPRTW